MTELLSIQIVNWNGGPELEKTLLALERSAFQEFELLLFDNGSSDGSERLVAQAVEARRRAGHAAAAFYSPSNTGFCAPNNRLLREGKAPWVLLLNADARPEPEAIGLLAAETSRYPETAMFAPKILEADQEGTRSSGRINAFGLGMFADGLNRGAGAGRSDSGVLDAEPDAFCPSGAAGLYRRDALQAAGGLTESYFAYGDDYDLGLKLRRMGHSCRRVPAARFLHRGSYSLGFGNPRRFYLIERNRLYNLVRHYPETLVRIAPLSTASRYAGMAGSVLTASGRVGRTVRADGAWPIARALAAAQRDAFARRRELREERRTLERRWPLDEGRFASWLNAFGLEPADAVR